MSSRQELESFAQAGANSPPDFVRLAEAALKTFLLLEPWYRGERSAEHPLVSSIIARIIHEADRYLEAIAKSVETANDGLTFAGDAVSFCDYLSHQNHSTEQLQNYVDSMIHIAKAAHERSLETNGLFREIRRQLYQICHDASRHMEENVHERPGHPEDRSRGGNAHFVSLPAPLESNDVMDNPQRINQGRELYDKSFEQVKAELGRIQSDLGQLIDCVDLFADWWGMLSSMLSNIRNVIPSLKAEGSVRLRNKDMRRRWEHVGSQCIQYSSRISLIQDAFPSDRTASRPSQVRPRPGNATGSRGRLSWRMSTSHEPGYQPIPEHDAIDPTIRTARRPDTPKPIARASSKFSLTSTAKRSESTTTDYDNQAARLVSSTNQVRDHLKEQRRHNERPHRRQLAESRPIRTSLWKRLLCCL